jgi:hypothetical protein
MHGSLLSHDQVNEDQPPVKGVATCIPSEIYEEATRLCRKEISGNRTPELIQLLMDLAVELPSKTPHYVSYPMHCSNFPSDHVALIASQSLLVGLLNVEEPEFVALLVDTLASSLSSSLHTPSLESLHKAKLLLRFIASLALVNVIHGSEFVNLLNSLLNSATSTAHSSGQVWNDQVVYLVAASLPWCGVELEVGHRVSLERLMEALEGYQGVRALKSDPALKPFTAPLTPPSGEEDRCFPCEIPYH